MNVSTRYDRWLAMMFVLLSLYIVVQFDWASDYTLLLFASGTGLYMLYKLYKGGVGSWRRVATDLGGGLVTLSIFVLIVWGYFLISM